MTEAQKMVRFAIPETLHRKLKGFAAATGRPLYTVLQDALAGYLDSGPAKHAHVVTGTQILAQKPKGAM